MPRQRLKTVQRDLWQQLDKVRSWQRNKQTEASDDESSRCR